MPYIVEFKNANYQTVNKRGNRIYKLTRRYYEHNENWGSYNSRVGTENLKEESTNPEFSNIKIKSRERAVAK
ncbi:MAG: hypothetical protein BACD_03042 [Bacteroides rodentium]